MNNSYILYCTEIAFENTEKMRAKGTTRCCSNGNKEMENALISIPDFFIILLLVLVISNLTSSMWLSCWAISEGLTDISRTLYKCKYVIKLHRKQHEKQNLNEFIYRIIDWRFVH